ncbi:ThiF family adenylyltransferase [Trinickia mobilis]|uniref:ThiF family adenylyltransferase n=1 Tax=Trinickia mobilis TaxID=2816356 RepID=UPI001A8ECF83|nr:ThiF family adenylyltransferase [Trinickia mobilis]
MNQEEKLLAASRPLGVAVELGASELNAASVYAKRVVLTGELPALSTRNGHLCFQNSLRLLSRIVGILDVVVPDASEDLQREVDEIVASLWSQGTIRRVRVEDNTFLGASAILNIGSEVRPDLPWTSILANGWVARCTSGSRPLPAETGQDNPLSCMLAASFGVTEVFKRIYAIPVDKAAPMEDAAFSLFELSCTFKDCGPPLPNTIALPETLILGAGAIGNGLVLVLSQLPLTGNVLLMDKQDFATENFGTCALLDSTDWIGNSKAKMLAEWLRTRSTLNVEGDSSTIEDALGTPTLKNNIDLVINGLDDVGARRAVQKLWPSLLVDGAINSAGAAVVTYSISHRRFACLRCTFREPNEDYIAQQVEATGLHKSSLEGDPNRLINDTDIAAADESAREWLREQQRQGKTICSTVSTGVAENLGLKLAKGFRPSVPFVATASAALVAAQVLRNLFWPEQRFVHEFQFGSVFGGPSTSTAVGRRADSECECTKNAGLIDMLIARRGGKRIEPVRRT